RPVSRALAVWTQVVCWITAAAFVIGAIAVANLRGAADRFYKAFDSTVDPASTDLGRKWIDAEKFPSGWYYFWVVASLAVAVLLIIWTYKVTRAVNRHQGLRRRWTHGWAVGGWFIPVANVVLPALVLMEDERIATAAARNEGDVSNWPAVGRRW